MNALLVVISLVLAGLLGFAAHRASICTVKAVAEVLTSRRAFMLMGFAKTVLWVMVVTLALGWLAPTAYAPGWKLSSYALAGGLIFGLGAVVNGGCAFSTLTRLASGHLAMLLTLAGFCLGALAHTGFVSARLLPTPLSTASYLEHLAPWTQVLLALLFVWAVWEGLRLWRTRPRGAAAKAVVLSETYRLSTAALLMGVSNAVLYALYGTWAYTGVLGGGVRQAMGANGTVNGVLWALSAAVLAGMFLSAWQARRIRLEWRPSMRWMSNLFGGLLMGLGAALVPGGNDVLLLNGIPGLSPHALPAYLAMIGGIFLALTAVRIAGGTIGTIDCRGDICAERLRARCAHARPPQSKSINVAEMGAAGDTQSDRRN